MRLELKNSLPIAEAFARLLHPFAEVVIHDLEKNQIEAIFNPFSRRQVGDSSYLDRWDFTVDPTENIIGPYEKTNFDGHQLKSISLVIRNHTNKAVGFLCVNMDISIFESYHNTLQLFLLNNDSAITKEKQSLFKEDLYEQFNLFIQDYCCKYHQTIKTLTRADKQKLILELKEKGALKSKNATVYIARILDISRASVYNYLK